MLNQLNLYLANLTTKEESRYSLSSIRVSPQDTRVTDGHIAVIVTLPPRVLPEHFPQMNGLTPTLDFEPFLLNYAAALEIARAIPSKPTVPALGFAAIGAESNLNGSAVIGVTDLDNPKLFQPVKSEGGFPDLSLVMPDPAKALVTVPVNPNYLLKIARELANFTKNERSPVVQLRIYSDTQVLRVDARNGGTEQDMTALVMPMRDDPTYTREEAKRRLAFILSEVENLKTKFVVREAGELCRLEVPGRPDRVLVAEADGRGDGLVVLYHADAEPIFGNGVTPLDVLRVESEDAAERFAARVEEGGLVLLGDDLKAAFRVTTEPAGWSGNFLLSKLENDDETIHRVVEQMDGGVRYGCSSIDGQGREEALAALAAIEGDKPEPVVEPDPEAVDSAETPEEDADEDDTAEEDADDEGVEDEEAEAEGQRFVAEEAGDGEEGGEAGGA
jgi:hypothetical protein